MSIADDVRAALTEVKEIEFLKDSKNKQELINDITKKTEHKRSSIEATLSAQIKKRVTAEGKNVNDFSNKIKKRFSSKLDISPNTEKVKALEGDNKLDDSVKNKSNMPSLKNPNATNQLPTVTFDSKAYESFGVSFNAIISSFVDNMEELTAEEKESFGSCLHIGFGDYLEGTDRARKIFGLVGILGLYTGKIRKAKKTSKKAKEKQELINIEKGISEKPKLQTPPPLKEITPQEKSKMAANNTAYLNLQDEV